MKLIFCMQINIKVSCQLLSILLASKFPTRLILSILMDMIKHSQSTLSNKFAIFSEYLKKEVTDGVHCLHVNKHQSFYKLALSFLMEVARHVQSTQNRKLLMFSQYVKEKFATVFGFYYDVKYLNILQGCSHVCCYLCCFCLF